MFKCRVWIKNLKPTTKSKAYKPNPQRNVCKLMTQHKAITLFFSLCCIGNTLLSAANTLSEYDPTVSVFLFQKKMATKGSAAAQYKLGTMYETGTGIPANISTAQRWYKKAAAQDYKAAQNRLIFLEIVQKGFSAQQQPWLKTLRHDARFGDGEALFLLAQLYNKGLGIKQDKALALKLLKKASAANIAGAEIERLKIENQLLQLSPKTQQTTTVQSKTATKKTKESITVSSALKNKQLQARQRKLQQAAIKQQQEALMQRYQQLEIERNKAIKKPTHITRKHNNSRTDSDLNKDICSGSNRFVASCR